MWKEPILQQILLITDGCSNEGTDPVYVAQMARAHGIATSVIAIVDEGSLGDQGIREAQNIAEAGGGMCRIVRVADLSRTMQMVTRQTLQLTLHQVVNAELRQLMGQETEALPPETRSKVAHLVETMSEDVAILLGLVIDVSASMNAKMNSVREAVRDLEFGLTARSGTHQLTVFTYPGALGEAVDVHRTSGENGSVADIIGAIRPSGNTPTGPALEFAMNSLLQREGLTPKFRPDSALDGETPGAMRDYVV